MTRDSDSLYHTERALEHLDDAIADLGVPLFALEHIHKGPTDPESRMTLTLARDASQSLTTARLLLNELRNRLVSP